MSLSIDQARGSLHQLENAYFVDHKGVMECTDDLIKLVKSCPALMQDAQASESLCRLTEGIYSMKGQLSSEKQQEVTQLFLRKHNLEGIPVQHFLEKNHPAKELLAQHEKDSALFHGGQEYSVPVSLLESEEMSCEVYFKTLTVVLKDGSEVKICQGLLARFSGMVKAMLQRNDMQVSEKLTLDQMDKHQFDSLVAFLETGRAPLINEENALPLMYAAAYLQIPEALDACRRFVYPHLNNEIIVHLLNLLEGKDNKGIISHLERQASESIRTALFQKPVDSATLDYYKENLRRSISIDLSGDDTTDDILTFLEGLPIHELELYKSQNLTKNCLPIIANLPTVKTLNLEGNNWVDDDVLAHMSRNIEKLLIGTCQNITGSGLAALQDTNVRTLDLEGCRHLRDQDFAAMADFESLNLGVCSGVGEKTMQRLGGMETLRHLDLSSAPITDDLLALLHKRLLTLDLSRCPVTDAVFESLKKMGVLRDLSLKSLKIQGKGLQQLPQSLIQLRLENNGNLADENVRPLASRSRLKLIGLLRCPKITSETVETFSNAGIKVIWQKEQVSRQVSRAFTY